MMRYDPSCTSCKISQGFGAKPGGVVALPGDWTVNHYTGSEGFLGWLALQTRYHHMELSELNSVEAGALGSNLQELDHALREFWEHKFPTDPVERVYFVYFFESPFETPKPKEQYHLHIHVIARPLSLAALLQPRGITTPKWADAWLTPRLNKRIPKVYRSSPQKPNRNVDALMRYIQTASSGT